VPVVLVVLVVEVLVVLDVVVVLEVVVVAAVVPPLPPVPSVLLLLQAARMATTPTVVNNAKIKLFERMCRLLSIRPGGEQEGRSGVLRSDDRERAKETSTPERPLPAILRSSAMHRMCSGVQVQQRRRITTASFRYRGRSVKTS
jgi:hypothetical protein